MYLVLLPVHIASGIIGLLSTCLFPWQSCPSFG